ncbi:hypothetical protein IL306_011995 [Fusarium sp. DS 682]|nr:hypothetical protein IL306_011995 [Fusarium sp. DS 682]
MGLSYLGYDGNGDYGRDVISTHSPLSDETYTMDGNTPVSLTLGGVETPRFQKHDTVFTLSQEDNSERPMVRGIQITPAEGQDVPADWVSQQPLLSQWNSSFFAIIDSSTPYLWLPDEVCDQFAQSFNLTYNSTFELYTISDSQYRAYTNDETFDLTFVLSSFDDNDNFGNPYDVPGIVNITIPLRAFVGLLQYPFMPDTIQYGDPAIPYFMLRKAKNSASYVLGRSFLQESYLITKYDEGVFSIHQALFPDEPSTNSELAAIEQSDNSPYPPPYAEDENGLSDGQVIGIGVGVGLGVFFVCAAALFVWLYFRRKRKRATKNNQPAENQNLTPEDGSRSLKSPLVILFSKILGRNNSAHQAGNDANDGEKVAEAPDTQIHEMSAPLPIAELDGNDAMSWNDDTEFGTDSSHNMSAYEMARKKLEKQLQGPVPTYSPPADGTEIPPEKAIYQPNPTNCPSVAIQLSPSASIKTTQQGGSTINSIPLPSPMTPGFDANGRPIEAPSPATIPGSPANDSISSPNSPLSPTSDHHTINSMTMGGSHSDREPHSPLRFSTEPQQRVVQRTPIDPSKVVFLGALPKNTRFSRHGAPQVVSGEEYQAADESSHRHGSVDTLGSNFTVEEERRSAGGSSRRLDLGTTCSPTNAVIEHSQQNASTDQPDTSRSRERINPGEDLVHVPQLAERRYSWEQ